MTGRFEAAALLLAGAPCLITTLRRPNPDGTLAESPLVRLYRAR